MHSMGFFNHNHGHAPDKCPMEDLLVFPFLLPLKILVVFPGRSYQVTDERTWGPLPNWEQPQEW